MQSFRVDVDRNLIEVTVDGFWRPDGLLDLYAQLRTVAAQLGSGVGKHALLCDLDGAQVGPAETVAMLTRVMSAPEFADFRARYVAFFSDSALMRMQMKRVAMARAGIAVLTTRAEALAWIDAQMAATVD